MAFQPVLPHLGRELIGFGLLFRGQGGIESGEGLMTQRRYLALQVGFLGAELVDLGRVVGPDRLGHCQANLFQLPADGLRGLAGRLKLRLGLGFLRRCQIQVLGQARAAIMPALLLHSGLRGLAAHFLSGQKHASGYRRSCRKT